MTVTVPSIFFVIPVAGTLLALLTVSFLWRFCGRGATEKHQFATIDGLRGYLALMVFFHHSPVWYVCLHTGRFELPPTPLFTPMGKGSVVLFFMITGFLFWTKLLDSASNPLDWSRLYVSRALRLTPLYLVVVFAMFAIIAVESGFRLQEPALDLARNSAAWLLFTIQGQPLLNRAGYTRAITSGVQWTLVYEWFFYLLLPAFALVLRRRPPVGAVIFSLVASAIVAWLQFPLQPLTPNYLFAFAGGIAAAYMAKSKRISEAVSGIGGSIAVTALMILTVCFLDVPSFPSILALSGVFIMISCGNSLFGVLNANVSRCLGEITYGIYLLHAMLLFLTINFVIGGARASGFSPGMYVGVILACVPVLILAGFLAFQFIEKPSLRAVPRVHRWLNGLRGETN